MIDSIKIPRRPPYDGEDVTVKGLNKVNFFFGSNGTGKTSLCELIESESDNASSDVIEWGHGVPLKTYVFDRDFVERNFRDSDNVPGVFTMGAESIEAQKDVDRLSADLRKNQDNLVNVTQAIADAENESNDIRREIEDICWQVKGELGEPFRYAFQGLNGSRRKFCDKALSALNANNENTEDIDVDELGNRLTLLYEKDLSHIEPIPAIDAESITDLEDDPILNTPIVGKEDLEISSLIEKLGNGDWVARGRTYLTDAAGKCPFCQQVLPADFESQIELFFDETYLHNMNRLSQVKSEYERHADDLTSSLENSIRDYGDYVDSSLLQVRLEEIKRITSENLHRISDKVANPGARVSLESAVEALEGVVDLISEANSRIASHNQLVINRDKERERASADAWACLSTKLNPMLERPLRRKDSNEKRLSGLRSSKEQAEQYVGTIQGQLKDAERRITSVHETVGDINDMLHRFGFDRFKLVVDATGKRYRVIRPNGELVGKTLSEGEKSFLTFLYFYYLMRGSHTAEGASEQRVVVIDDPISSMDADVLFITSSLVRIIADEARKPSSPIEQLLVFTHNVSFHREVSLDKWNKNKKTDCFYFIKKSNSGSLITPSAENPINGTYELLWKNLYEDDCSSLTAQNAARRIAESFFRFVGGTNIRDLSLELQGNDLAVARSFILWANSGSHNVLEDETDFNPTLSAENYRRILKVFFEKAGYPDHYQMMASRYEH